MFFLLFSFIPFVLSTLLSFPFLLRVLSPISPSSSLKKNPVRLLLPSAAPSSVDPQDGAPTCNGRWNYSGNGTAWREGGRGGGRVSRSPSIGCLLLYTRPLSSVFDPRLWCSIPPFYFQFESFFLLLFVFWILLHSPFNSFLLWIPLRVLRCLWFGDVRSCCVVLSFPLCFRCSFKSFSSSPPPLPSCWISWSLVVCRLVILSLLLCLFFLSHHWLQSFTVFSSSSSSLFRHQEFFCCSYLLTRDLGIFVCFDLVSWVSTFF